MTPYQLALEHVGRAQPQLWAALYPRAYRDTADWHSPKIPAVMLSTGVSLACSSPWEALPPSIQSLYLAASQCVAHAMPTYFVARSLCEAVARTNPPADLAWTDIQMPHPGLSLILPRGTLRHPTEGEVGAICLARLPALDPIAFPAVGAPTRRLGNDVLVACAIMHETSAVCYDLRLSADSAPRLGDLATVTEGTSIRGDGTSEPISADDAAMPRAIMSLALRLVLLMQARPDLVEPGECTGIQRRARQGPPLEYWTPTIIGRGYRTQVAGDLPPVGTHAGPRLHWRRGHYAAQPYGPGYSLRKIIWREPVLVGEIKEPSV